LSGLSQRAVEGWHPLKRSVLITTRFGETPQLHEVGQPGGARRSRLQVAGQDRLEFARGQFASGDEVGCISQAGARLGQRIHRDVIISDDAAGRID
jgi:hypothetical protein